jgi:hypothetical protein
MRYFINGRQVSGTGAFQYLIRICEQRGYCRDTANDLWLSRETEYGRDEIAECTGATLEILPINLDIESPADVI